MDLASELAAKDTYSAGTEAGGGRKDFLGYYALLGLDGDVGSGFTQPDIKRAFHEAALRWHPDRLHVTPPLLFARLPLFL